MNNIKIENFEIKKLEWKENISNINKILEIFQNIHNENFKNKVNNKYFLEILENNQYTIYYLEKNTGEISGYIIYYDTFDSVDLFEIVIKKEKHKKGFGNFLLKNSINEIFFFKNRNSIILEVNEKNKNAIKLYEANGFKKISMRKNYYGKDENAIIMMRSKE